jgi:hypothetical protein
MLTMILNLLQAQQSNLCYQKDNNQLKMLVKKTFPLENQQSELVPVWTKTTVQFL